LYKYTFKKFKDKYGNEKFFYQLDYDLQRSIFPDYQLWVKVQLESKDFVWYSKERLDQVYFYGYSLDRSYFLEEIY